jgi:transposase
MAAQGEVIFQDDTPQRLLTLIAENQQAQARAQAQGKAKTEERTGRQTTALLVQVGARRICLSYTGRRHAGENLAALLRKREPDRGKPLVMSDALSHNNAEEDTLIRCHCLAHGRRKFRELDEAFPVESAVVVNALKDVFDHQEYTRAEQLTAQDRLT